MSEWFRQSTPGGAGGFRYPQDLFRVGPEFPETRGAWMGGWSTELEIT